MKRTDHPRKPRFETLERRRLLAVPGSLDPTFSHDGKATFSFAGASIWANDVAVQADGKVVVVGMATIPRPALSDETRFAVARFNVDGTPDTTFGNNGIALTQVSDENISFAQHSFANAVAIASDGRIVVVGAAERLVSSITTKFMAAIVVHKPDGTRDTSFDDDGLRRVDLSDDSPGADTIANDVAIGADGKIVVVGGARRSGDDDCFVIRLLPDGSLDRDVTFPTPGGFVYTGFNGDGVAFVALGGNDAARAVRIDSSGDVLVAGNSSSIPQAGLIRLSNFGHLVSTFDGDGILFFSIPGATTKVADFLMQSDGKIVIAGHAHASNGLNEFYIARFFPNGALNTSFGEFSSGYTVTDLGGNDTAEGIIATPTGGGGGFIVSGNSDGMAAVKYTDNGLPDTNFGSGGEVRLLFGGTAAIARGPGRRVVLAGGADFATARLLLAGAGVVTAFAIDSVAREGSTNTGSLLVGRTENLPFPTRVFFNIGGTATLSSSRTSPRDWSMPGMAISSVFTPTLASGFVDIPAGESFVQLTLNTINDSLKEPTESVTFSITSNSLYDIGSPNGGTISIADDDLLSSRVGTTTVAKPPKHVGVGQELQAAVTWTVPTGGWRQLSTIQLRLRDWHDGDALAILTFDEATNSFSVESTPGANNPVSLVLSKCTFQAAGPDAPTVTIIFTFVFNAAAANTRFRLDVAAENDAGVFSGFEQIGELHVHKKPKGDVLALLL